ncbi:site-specific DNA-methyltransferase [Thiothrix sp.]|uniref:site-specific DNA-methyltransferase n=1 Tax=Thiothrix sp. TaxID=1032 RepID=UPI00257EDA6C|nr:site-specific DNA-methyltransferase [Thiothrix sp.]
MPTLNWIGKQAVASHHKEVPFRLVEPVPELSVGDIESGNLIVQGDNLWALKALLPRYAGQVKCIYIDPPYNTGNEGWVYNDNVNSPEIRRWLGETVGKEGETLDRHDRWLCMMYPRLMLLKQFLRPDGAIFISIDDNEVASLRLIMDEIFGITNHVATFVWKRRTTPDSRNQNGISPDHEYIIVYQVTNQFRVIGQSKDLEKYTNPDNDPRGTWMSDNLTGLANPQERPNLHYEIIHPKTGARYSAHPSRGWIYGRERMDSLIADNKILWPKKPDGRPRLKRFVSDMLSETTGFSTALTAPGNVAATKELSEIMGPKVFAFPKPSELIQKLICQSTGKNDLVLDSFAGSGTTAHAVLKQNAEDGGNRRFILVEMDNTIAHTVTAERVKRVSQGYTSAKNKEVTGLGSGFQFYQLSQEPLFAADGKVRPDVTFRQLAEFVWFTETGTGLTLEPATTFTTPLLGIFQNRAIFMLYNGILKDKTDLGGNVLNAKTLHLLQTLLPEKDMPCVVFGARTRFDKNTLTKLNITFHQLPYELAAKTWF